MKLAYLPIFFLLFTWGTFALGSATKTDLSGIDLSKFKVARGQIDFSALSYGDWVVECPGKLFISASRGVGKKQIEKFLNLLEKKEILSLFHVGKIATIRGEETVLTQVSMEQFKVNLNVIAPNWVSLMKPIPQGQAPYDNVHYVSSAVSRLNEFVFTSATKKSPILLTNGVHDCVVIMAYDTKTQRGFMAHLSPAVQDLNRKFNDAFNRLIKNEENPSSLASVQVTLATRVLSNFSESVLKEVRDLKIQSIQTNSNPALVKMTSKRSEFYHHHVYVNPAEMSLTDFFTELSESHSGRTIFFDTSSGGVFEQL